ncbi:hypothetical protein D3C76_1283610 [compost metagenome]
MGVLVDQRAAAFPFPGGTPGAGIMVALGTVPVGNDPYGAFDAAQLSAFHQVPDLLVHRVGALVVHDAEQLVGFLGRFVHFQHLLGMHARRLLHQHMQPMLEALDGKDGMVIVGHGDQHSVDQAAFVHGYCVLEHRNTRQGLLRPFPSLPADIAYGPQNQVRDKLIQMDMLGMGAPHVAQTDYTNSDFIHKLTLPPSISIHVLRAECE